MCRATGYSRVLLFFVPGPVRRHEATASMNCHSRMATAWLILLLGMCASENRLVPIRNKGELMLRMTGCDRAATDPVVVVVPGLAGYPTHGVFDNTLMPLSTTHCVVQYDMRGTGLSEKSYVPIAEHGADLVAIKEYMLRIRQVSHVRLIVVSFGSLFVKAMCDQNCSGVDRVVFVSSTFDGRKQKDNVDEYLSSKTGIPVSLLRSPDGTAPIQESVSLLIKSFIMNSWGGGSMHCKEYVRRTRLPCMRFTLDILLLSQTAEPSWIQLPLQLTQNLQELVGEFDELTPESFDLSSVDSVVMLHGTEDEIVPIDSARTSFRDVRAAHKYVYEVPASHNLLERFESFDTLSYVVSSPHEAL